MGFPLPGALGTEVKYTSGDVSALSGAEDDKRVIQISAPIQPGNSGGPLALSDGRIVGVIVSSLNFRFALKSSGSLPQNVNFAVKSDYLRILAANSGVDIPDDLKVIGSPVDHVGAFTVQVICTQ
jgi:S1-C subfamily serine protease